MGFLFIFLNVSSILVMATLMFIAFHRLGVKGSANFGVVCLFAVFWALGSCCEVLSPSFPLKLFWRNVTQIGTFGLPVATVLFALSYTGRSVRTRRIVAAILYPIMALPVVLIWTNPGLMRKSVSVVANSFGYSVTSIQLTSLGAFSVSINYAEMLFSIAMLLSFMIRLTPSLRLQVLSIIGGLALPSLFSLLKNALGESFWECVPSSVAFDIGAAFILFGIYGKGFLSLTPIARHLAFDVMDEGILVFSPNGSLIDVNPAAGMLLARHVDEVYGGKGGTRNFLNRIEELIGGALAVLRDAPQGQSTVKVRGNDVVAHYSMRRYPFDATGGSGGEMIIFRDVTDETKEANALRRRATKDPLTGTYNRAEFQRIVEDALSSEPSAGCLLIFDVDHFKDVNDRFGHLVGDEVLRGICSSCRSALRTGDVFGRIGGDEFAVFISGLDINGSSILAERLVSRVKNSSFSAAHGVSVSISVGLAQTSPDQDEEPRVTKYTSLFSRADKALYRAKAEGRDRISLVC